MELIELLSRRRAQPLWLFKNKIVKCRVSFVVVILISLTFIAAQFLYITPTSVHRPKTKIEFVNKDFCVLSTAENNNLRTVVIVVLSARNHFDRRNLIRQTYGSVRKAFNVHVLGVVFMLGNLDAPGSDVTDGYKLREEINPFGDIVVGDFVDCYRNLTLKTIMAYEWLTSYCRDAQVVVKTDDDVFVNIFELAKELDSWSQAEIVSSNIWCIVDRNEPTVKDKNSIYYASPLDFPTGVFPDHCEGLAYITPIGVIDRIINEIRQSFPGTVCTHEDVFMTAVVRQHINSNSNYFWRKPEPIEIVNKKHFWRSLDLQDGRGDEDYFLRNLIKSTSIDADSLQKFRIWYDKKIFYLITHSDDFSDQYVRLWKIVSAASETDIL
ncbi:UDP-GalNAc:beta-1,3-N-acetylgalactosaminyltransferase 1-like isoform X5 [Bradysia coprophila]|uniref:UDP-GalNAc:beta-1, 3-N-acetylgalactosaminyltransferase 1-like isoform X3 n=1 Tax=Bradysia coprophila TaxID=38358 RepID=UPI00187DB356|nr:UDP-GalNAc:beta-1,3-N-acetylgalactosaminyltransferase 1-like isoform X3 [Bradysia coprophila]XP_037025610.1 UDP-GalNAc:beta-1,3-N-acetylgalactosaminyltransferase 1-like isoform X4 [Bradysia coprophila]XP_037025617.1 UDP-GalNAc:beta-1,3-N-acetylgalactosaminyltransferase 1-like isoform X5 [Bradysia coprophila]